MFPECPQLADHLLCLLLGRQCTAGRFQLLQFLLKLLQNHSGFFHPGHIFLHFDVGLGLLVIVKLFQPILDFTDLSTQLTNLRMQGIHFRNFFFQRIAFCFRQGQQSTAVISAAVFQIFQFLCQSVCRSTVITGGYQCIQPSA